MLKRCHREALVMGWSGRAPALPVLEAGEGR
jgi:hypothetical protein